MRFNLKKLSKDTLSKRVADNLTFRAIATQTKGRLTPTTLQRIEAGSQMPKCDTLADVCGWLKQPVSKYFY